MRQALLAGDIAPIRPSLPGAWGFPGCRQSNMGVQIGEKADGSRIFIGAFAREAKAP